MKPIDFKPDRARRKRLMRMLRDDITAKSALNVAFTCGMLRHPLWTVASMPSHTRAYRLAMRLVRER